MLGSHYLKSIFHSRKFKFRLANRLSFDDLELKHILLISNFYPQISELNRFLEFKLCFHYIWYPTQNKSQILYLGIYQHL